MSFTTILGLGQTALELGLMSSLTVLALFLSYTMLNVCDLSTDGCFTLGAAVGAVVGRPGPPIQGTTAAMQGRHRRQHSALFHQHRRHGQHFLIKYE